MVENFSRFLSIINYRSLDFFPSQISSYSLSLFLPFLSFFERIGNFSRFCIDNFQFDYPFTRAHLEEEANTGSFRPEDRSNRRKAHIWMSDATRSSVGQWGQMDGFSCLKTQGQSFKNGAEKFWHRWWWSISLPPELGGGPRSRTLYIHYIMMFIVVPTGTIVSKVNI